MKTTQQVPPNPMGKGGFGDNPQNRNPGGWKPENTISYQYRRFMKMAVVELDKWLSNNKDTMTVVEHLAYKRVLEAKKSLPDIKEITDRTEGKPPQAIDHTSGGDKIESGFLAAVEKIYGGKGQTDGASLPDDKNSP